MRFAMLCEYDGTDFHGSQLQVDIRTVQGELEDALARIYGTAIRIRLASRTDTGVHATGQVAAFDAEAKLEPQTMVKALNYHLPADVAVAEFVETSEDFDPRRDAVCRRYEFMLNDGPVPSPTRRTAEVRIPCVEDIDSMEKAAEHLVGTHDFASFAGPATPPGAETVRRIDVVTIARTSPRRIRVLVKGSAFLHQQVRRMVGALARVGSGQLGLQEFTELISLPERGKAGWRLGPQGLYLTGIEYGSGGPFGARTEYN